MAGQGGGKTDGVRIVERRKMIRIGHNALKSLDSEK